MADYSHSSVQATGNRYSGADTAQDVQIGEFLPTGRDEAREHVWTTYQELAGTRYRVHRQGLDGVDWSVSRNRPTAEGAGPGTSLVQARTAPSDTEPEGSLHRDSTVLQFSVVSAGTGHTCALDTNDEIHCWRSNSYDQKEAPGGQFDSVSAESYHTCAVDARAGSIHCGGRNSHGQ